MTSLAISLSVDSRGPCALYIITDSRITWGNSADRWDAGQKTFSSKRFPDVFGYCGDAYFPPMILRQVTEQLDAGLLCADNADSRMRHDAFLTAMKTAISRVGGKPPRLNFTVYHGARDLCKMDSEFLLWETKYFYRDDRWTDNRKDLKQSHSYIVQVDGTGATSIELHNDRWQSTAAAQTSRSGVWAFFDSLRSKADKFSGGPPQIVGIWRINAGRPFGVVWNYWPHLAGLRATGDLSNPTVRWFDETFEPCDAQGNRLNQNKAHPRPL
jgi:hypothetical protein